MLSLIEKLIGKLTPKKRVPVRVPIRYKHIIAYDKVTQTVDADMYDKL